MTYIDTRTGLLNADCSVMPVMIFTADHKAETIDRVVAAVKAFRGRATARHGVKFQLATGNVGVMAATNEVVGAAQFPMLLWVFGAVIAALPARPSARSRGDALRRSCRSAWSRCSPTR